MSGWIPRPVSDILTTKGDIAVHNGTEVVALPVGTDDQVLTADSTKTEGVTWADATGGGGSGLSYAETIGDGSNSSFQVNHALGTEDLVVQLWDLTGSDPVEATADADSITVDDEDNITVAFSAPPASDSYRVVIVASGGTPAGGSSGFVLLDEVVISGSAQAAIEFTNIDQSFKDLRLVARLKSARASNTSDVVDLVFGDGSYDTGASAYRWLINYANATTNPVADDADDSIVCGRIAAADADAGAFGLLDGIIGDYTTAAQRVFAYQGGGYWTVGTSINVAAGSDAQQVSGLGVWLNTSDPIERLRLTANSGADLVVGCWARIYGLG